MLLYHIMFDLDASSLVLVVSMEQKNNLVKHHNEMLSLGIVYPFFFPFINMYVFDMGTSPYFGIFIYYQQYIHIYIYFLNNHSLGFKEHITNSLSIIMSC